MQFQKYFSKLLLKDKKKNYSEDDYLFKTEIEKILGVQIENLDLYKEAFSLRTSSKLKNKKNYERLEFLGDSVLGTIISCYLFEKYATSNEGYLTQMKSKIVNRKNLNRLGDELGLKNLIQNKKNLTLSENISGNLLEALIGSIYLDFNYELCHRIVLEKLLKASDIFKLENKIISYKGLLLEWSQKKKVAICYETCEEFHANNILVFRSCIILDQEKISNATDSSKKKAEEKAAQRAFYVLNKKENIVENQKIIS
ncbi:ribonuclease III family protein [Halpernia frigidisoli]|uniref:Ribonuclease 3 n=1 Tax=Halpernia frigidisoli TaxID=1125876 RepID=A0A1I3GDI0_9FLAO|nr:ribonuclease III domain-containing protein [Halpernia frigidisoli]SFI21467.1 RNAse III [Halpernia frigidisoli]